MCVEPQILHTDISTFYLKIYIYLFVKNLEQFSGQEEKAFMASDSGRQSKRCSPAAVAPLFFTSGDKTIDRLLALL